MAETKITFQSGGFKLAGTVRVPDGVKPGERRPAFIVMHGFGSNSSSSNVLEPCKMFEKLGYVTLRIDMPGCGESEGPRGNLICLEQVQAASDALTFLAKNPNVEGDRIGMIGSSFGAAIAVYVCGVDKRVAAAISSGGWGDGERKFRGQHPGEAAWKKFTDMLAEGKRHREKTGKSLMVPRYDIVPIPAASARPSGAELDPGVHRRDRAEHVRLPRRRRDRQGRRPADPAAAFVGRFGDADRAVDRDVQARRLSRAICTCSPRPITSCSRRATRACAA